MHIGNILRGDTLVCCRCEHERDVTDGWVATVCAKHFSERKPARLYESDLGRFRCSACQSKSLLKRGQPHELTSPKAPAEQAGSYQLAVAYLEQASHEERQVLLNWAQGLVAIRDSPLSALEKAKSAILLTTQSGAIRPFIVFLGGEIKRVGWDERGLPERLALSVAAAAALMFSGQGAGIAALGGAIGVPLWVVFGAGGAFVGVLIDEARRRIDDEAKK